jgi:type II secretory pathway pseudopilin PulG
MKQPKENGWIMIEIITALGVLVVIMACISLSARTFGKLNAVQLRKQQCLSAAQAQLDSIVMTGERIGQDDLNKLWQGVEISVEAEQGKGQWKGLRLVKVTAKAMAQKRQVKVELSRYLAPEGGAK